LLSLFICLYFIVHWYCVIRDVHSFPTRRSSDLVMGLGTSVGGEKIIKSVGMDMVKLERYQGFAADLSGALCLLYSSLFGIQVSKSEEHTSELQSRFDLVCRLLLGKKSCFAVFAG